ncbi:MAG: serine/threonine-protein kinase [Planctomycetota bacterium]|nr:serine/threonine-protein kinase [Planctomycetota bacterium]
MNRPTVTGSHPVLPPACPSCGTALPEGAQFCPGCGRRMVPLGNVAESTAMGSRVDRHLASTGVQPDSQTSVNWAQAEMPQRYRVMRLIGRGGMGVVFQCMDQMLQRPVAIKLMSDRYRQDVKAEKRFLREARAQATINHPNVAQVLNAALTNQGRPYLVMEYIDGQDLRQIVRDYPNGLDIARTCRLVEKVCDGLTEAHARGVVHRDLKPSNLIVHVDHRGREQIKILDLGLAKIIGGATDLKTITVDTASILVGTPAYMSPEQVSGAEVDPRADIYALGVVLFEMVTGRLPFESETLEGWLYQHLHAHPPLPSTLRPGLAELPDLEHVVLWCLAKQPGDRPQSPLELSEALSRIRAQAPPTPARPVRAAPAALTETLANDAPEPDEDPFAEPGAIQRTITALYERPSADKLAPPEPFAFRQPQQVQRSPDPASLKRERFLELSRAAEMMEEQGRWVDAIQKWKEALPYADDAETVNSQVESLKREVEFDRFLGTIRNFAAAGDWSRAEAALSGASAMRPGDPRIQQARARLPRRLVEAWLKGARSRLEAFPDGATRRHLIRRMTLAYARLGDMTVVIDLLQEQIRDREARIIGLAQAAQAAIQAGLREGMRPNLERTIRLAEDSLEGLSKLRALVEIARALVSYGDVDSAVPLLDRARAGFQESLRSPEVMKQVLKNAELTTTRIGRSRRSSKASDFKQGQTPSGNLATVAEIQAEAGLADEAIKTTGAIEDPWIRSQTLASVAEVLARMGRCLDAESLAEQIGMRLAKAKALSAAAIGHLNRGDAERAAKLMRDVGSPEARAPVQAALAAAWKRGGETVRANTFAREALESTREIQSNATRIAVLLKCAESLLQLEARDLAEPFLSMAARLIDGIEEPTERLLDLAELSLTRLIARQVGNGEVAATTTHQIHDCLVRALNTLRRIVSPMDREECIEKLAQALGEAGVPDLAENLLSQVQGDQERGIALVGLASGLL